MKRKLLKTKFDINKAILKGYRIVDGYDKDLITLQLLGNIEMNPLVLSAIDCIAGALYSTKYEKYAYIPEDKIYIQSLEEFIDLLGQGKEIQQEDYDSIKYCMRAGVIYAHCEENDKYNINPEIIFEKDKFYYKGD